MRRAALLAVASGVLATAAIPLAIAQSPEEQKRFTPQDIKWSPAPPSLPAGAEVALLYGDATKEGLFALRLKVPKGYRVPPHTHPKPEIGTVLSGTVRLGMGDRVHASDLFIPNDRSLGGSEVSSFARPSRVREPQALRSQ